MTAICSLVLTLPLQADQKTVTADLTSGDAASLWHLTPQRAGIADGALRLDGTDNPAGGLAPAMAVLKTPAFADVSLSGQYMVEQDPGVQAVGLVIGSTDSLNFYYVHYDRSSAILCRSNVDESWDEIKRAAAPHEPGKWYSARLERKGTKLGVYFQDKLLFEADAPDAAPGLVGFYASQTVAHVKDVKVTGTTA
ncbi:MAG: hypothetical protein JXQ73_27545, partial [Phycisphaerae bacterium]|nr:hypothetical protein [Phycisphaerae bacterium]